MPLERQRTFCRICEAHCGLVVEVERATQQVLQILPDREHPVSQGSCCAKGLRLGEVHHDADRLNYPLERTPTGFQRISWSQALAKIGGKLKQLRAAHGPRSIAMYRGNPSFFSYQHYLFASGFMDALGSPNSYCSVSIDSNPKFFVAQHMFGHPLLQPIVDIAHTRLFVCLGSNPAISQMSILEMPNPVGRLQEIVARGGRVLTIDPRRTETARRVGEHWFIRPGTDVYLLLGLVHVLLLEQGVAQREIERHSVGLDALRSAAQPWTPERAAASPASPPRRFASWPRRIAAQRAPACMFRQASPWDRSARCAAGSRRRSAWWQGSSIGAAARWWPVARLTWWRCHVSAASRRARWRAAGRWWRAPFRWRRWRRRSSSSTRSAFAR